jgi:hypothetical protein
LFRRSTTSLLPTETSLQVLDNTKNNCLAKKGLPAPASSTRATREMPNPSSRRRPKSLYPATGSTTRAGTKEGGGGALPRSLPAPPHPLSPSLCSKVVMPSVGIAERASARRPFGGRIWSGGWWRPSPSLSVDPNVGCGHGSLEGGGTMTSDGRIYIGGRQ